jgi:hypothetical protein
VAELPIPFTWRAFGRRLGFALVRRAVCRLQGQRTGNQFRSDVRMADVKRHAVVEVLQPVTACEEAELVLRARMRALARHWRALARPGALALRSANQRAVWMSSFGAALAREMVHFALAILLRRMPALKLDANREIVWYRNADNRGPINLPVVGTGPHC